MFAKPEFMQNKALHFVFASNLAFYSNNNNLAASFEFRSNQFDIALALVINEFSEEIKKHSFIINCYNSRVFWLKNKEKFPILIE